jgi:aspartyl/asparaginyl-tRNA synthetase
MKKSVSKLINEKNLLYTSIAVSIIGLAILFFYAEEIKLVPTGSLDEIMVEEEVSVYGKVSKVSQYDTVTFIEVDNYVTDTTKVILFQNQDLALEEGNVVEISGTVEEYEGELEIIANSVEIVGR